MYELFEININKSLTISGLALGKFLTYHYDNNSLALIKDKSIYNDLKLAYYGGITEVYRPYGENLYYYDVNSLYPYVALQDMPGNKCTQIDYLGQQPNLNELFGFFYCEIEVTENKYIGLLPYRTSKGLVFPLGNWRGWYFSEEIKLAVSQGYKVNIIKGYKFNRVCDVFKSYINDIYKIKSSTKDSVERNLSKSLLNNLLGRFGLDINKATSKILSHDSYATIAAKYPIVSETTLEDNWHIISYLPSVDPSLCKSLGIDMVKLINKFNIPDESVSGYKDVSISVSAAVTSYGRIHMSKLKLAILDQGANIYYSDTDSIITDKALDTNLVDANILGKLKLEHKVSKGYFISSKTYALVLEDGSTVFKAKGLNSLSLTLNDYINMLKGELITTGIKTISEKNYFLADRFLLKIKVSPWILLLTLKEVKYIVIISE